MENVEMYEKAASTMSYLFLRFVVGKQEIAGALKEEMGLFFEEVSKLEKVPESFYQSTKTEMDEGDYTEGRSRQEFSNMVSQSVEEIMGYSNESIFNLYTKIAGEIFESRRKIKESVL